MERNEKVELCRKIWKLYDPMSMTCERWLDALPKNMQIELPFDDFDFFNEIILLILDIKIDRMKDDFLDGWVFDDGYTEEKFIDNINYWLDVYEV